MLSRHSSQSSEGWRKDPKAFVYDPASHVAERKHIGEKGTSVVSFELLTFMQISARQERSLLGGVSAACQFSHQKEEISIQQ